MSFKFQISFNLKLKKITISFVIMRQSQLIYDYTARPHKNQQEGGYKIETKAHRKAVIKYLKNTTKAYIFHLNKVKDNDIIEKMENAPTKIELFRKAIRAYKEQP